MPNPTATIFVPYHAFDDLILRGLRASQPPAGAVTPGTLYCVTDEASAIERSNGLLWEGFSPAGGGGGGTLAPHHLTHEPGGSDALTGYEPLIGATLVMDQGLLVNAPREGVTLVMNGPSQGSSYRFLYGTAEYGGLYSRLDGGLVLDTRRTDIPIILATNGITRLLMDPTGLTELRRDQGASFVLGRSQMLVLRDMTGNDTSRLEIALGYLGGTYFPAVIGYRLTDPNGTTKGELYFGTRDVVTDSPPVPRLTIAASGQVTIQQSLAWGGGAAIPSSSNVMLVGSGVAAHHATHEPGGSDAIAALNASVLTSGTLPDARLSANVQLKPLAVADLPAHAARHQPGGADALAVDAVAATGSLRTLGTGAQQAASGTDSRFTDARTPAAHHATHEPGGSDPLAIVPASILTGTVAKANLPASIAYEDEANVFTQNQRISKATPDIQLNDTVQPADARLMRIHNTGGSLVIDAANDAGSSFNNVLTVNRSGNVLAGGNLTATGSGGNVACKDQANVFTAVQTIGSGGFPALYLDDAGQAADLRQWIIYTFAQTLRLQPANDAGSGLVNVLVLNRSGDVSVGRILNLTAGGQIQFPSTPIPSADPNTIDDYKEGNLTMVDASGAGLVLTSNTGWYIKIGRLIFGAFAAVYPATANGLPMLLGGLPYAGTDNLGGGYPTYYAIPGQPPVYGTILGGSTGFQIRAVSSAGVLTNAQLSGATVQFSFMYRTT